MHAQIDWPVVHGQRFEGAFQIILQGGVERYRQRANGVAGCPGISRIGFDQKFRTIAPQKIPAEIFRNIDDELHLTASEQIVSFSLGSNLSNEIIITAVLKGGKQGATFRAMIGEKDGCGQMLWISVDSEPKQY